MEEDIKVLEEFIKNPQEEYRKTEICGEPYELPNFIFEFKPTKKIAQAIENLINRNKELEKQMGKDLDVVYLQGVYNERDKWKSKVREKIEEINNELLNFNEDDYWIEQEMKGYAIDHIQELL